MDFDVTDQLLIRLCAVVRKRMGVQFAHFKKAYDSVRREVLYNILIELGVAVKLVTLIKMCLNETYFEVRTGLYSCTFV
jgi:purine nucleoside phosphorylase